MNIKKKIDMYKKMLRIRYFEEETAKQIQSGIPTS